MYVISRRNKHSPIHLEDLITYDTTDFKEFDIQAI